MTGKKIDQMIPVELKRVAASGPISCSATDPTNKGQESRSFFSSIASWAGLDGAMLEIVT